MFNVKVSDFTGKLTTEQAGEWANIVGAFARALPLYATNPEEVSAEVKWLHGYTGGNIGTLKAVMVEAAAQLILAGDPGKEVLTPDLLKQSVRDYAAEVGDVGVDEPAPLPGAHKRKRLLDAG